MNEQIKKLWFADGRIWIDTSSGTRLSQPLEVFPSLLLASPAERENYYLWDNNMSIRWGTIDEDIHLSNFFEDNSVNYDNEVNLLFKRFPWLDMKVFAEYLGMHWTKLARFRYGVWVPSEETVNKIKAAIHTIGNEMSAAVL